MRRRTAGFTLLEVMLGLALLGMALTVLIKSASGSMFGVRDAHMTGIATDLARAKMYDIEEKLLKDGFTDTDQGEEGETFEEEGFPKIRYSYKVEEVELPSYQDLMALAQGRAAAGSGGSASGSGSAGDEEGSAFTQSFTDSALGGMLMGGMLGGGGDVGDAEAGALIQGQYKLFQDILKVSIRKITLVVEYEVSGREKKLTTVMFMTDAGAMDKVLAGLGQTDLDDQPGAGGPGSAAPSGSTRPPRAPGSAGR